MMQKRAVSCIFEYHTQNTELQPFMSKITPKPSDKQESKEKFKYKVTNWSSYNKALSSSDSSSTLWFNEESLSG